MLRIVTMAAVVAVVTAAIIGPAALAQSSDDSFPQVIHSPES